MDILKITQLLEKYEAAETSLDEEKQLAEYFIETQDNMDAELRPYAMLFTQFATQRHEKAPATVLGNIIAQQHTITLRRKQIWNISMGIAASLMIVLGIALFHKPASRGEIVMYSNGKRVDDPMAAIALTQREFAKISATLIKTNEIISKPRKVINHSLEPIRKTAIPLQKTEQILFGTTENQNK